MRRSPARRQFRTVLFTDVVGSTELAAQLGDHRWRQLVARHHAAIRRELRRHRGSEVDTAGDGFFATFENPTDAVRCAAAAVAAVHGLGLRIRAGIHTGEVESSGDKVAGIAVHIGARLLALAGLEEVLVSSTVRDLVTGSGFEFNDRGEQQLKGVPGTWHIYALELPRLETMAVTSSEDDEERAAAGVRRQRLVVVALVGVIALMIGTIAGYVLLFNRPSSPTTGTHSVVAFGLQGDLPVSGIRTGRGPRAVALDSRWVWVANQEAGTVSRIDSSTYANDTFGLVGSRPSRVEVGSGRVWVVDPYSNLISVLAADTGALVATLGLHASALTVTSDAVWATDDLQDEVVRIDPATARVAMTGSLASSAGPSGLAMAGGVLWVAQQSAGTVARINLASATVDGPGIPFPGAAPCRHSATISGSRVQRTTSSPASTLRSLESRRARPFATRRWPYPPLRTAHGSCAQAIANSYASIVPAEWFNGSRSTARQLTLPARPTASGSR